MMSKKTKRLYGRMQHGISKKQEAVDVLERKRKNIEDSGSKKEPAGKVEPLKKKKKNWSKEEFKILCARCNKML